MTLLKLPPPGQRYDGKPVKQVKAWSHSAVTFFEDCPQRFYAVRILGWPDPPSKALLNGRKVHEAGAEYLKVPSAPLPAAYKKFDGLMAQVRALDADADVKMTFTQSWSLGTKGWFGDDVWMRLEWDAAVRYADKTADIVDFKTGKRYDDKNDDQMELYALSAFIKYRSPEVMTRLWYLDSGLEIVGPGGNKQPYKIEQAGALMSKWTERANKMLHATSFPPRPNKFCEYCPVSSRKGGPCAEG